MHEEHESCEAGILLENSPGKEIFRTQFALLLFLFGLMSSILSFATGLFFVERKSLFKKRRARIYCALQAFYWRILLGKETLVEEPSFCYLL